MYTIIAMNTERIVSALDEELARLRQVRDLLAGSSMDSPNGAPEKRRRGRPPKSAAVAAKPVVKKRMLSDEARKRIADAQKRRWAAQKAQ